MTDTVLALFGPTASGKTAVAQAIAERIPAELVSADSMQVYRGLPILTNQSPARLVGIWPLDHEASVAEYQAPRARGDRRDSRGRPNAGRRRRDRPLPAGRTRRSHAAAGARAGRARALGAALRRARERSARTSGSPSSIPRRPRPSIPTTAAASCAASSSPDGSASATSSGPTRRGTRRSCSASTCRKTELDRRIADAHASHVRGRGPSGGGGRARGLDLARPPPTRMASSDLAEQPDDEAAIEALVARTRRYAAYQRKWMRRIPGLVSLPADRPPGEIADAILEVARARQRLPAGRAG